MSSLSSAPVEETDAVAHHRDWRRILCNNLGVSSSIRDDDLEDLLGNWVSSKDSHPQTPEPATPPRIEPFYKLLYRTSCGVGIARDENRSLWSDEPFVVSYDSVNSSSHLAGKESVSDPLRYMDRHTGICFLVIQEYHCCGEPLLVDFKKRLTPQSESVIFASADLCQALNELQADVSDGINTAKTFSARTEIPNLSYWLYCFQKDWKHLHGEEMDQVPDVLKCFIRYAQIHMSPRLEVIRCTFAQGLVTRDLLPYLFVPYEVYVLKHSRGREYYQGARLSSWPIIETDVARSKASIKSSGVVISIKADHLCWGFDGYFKQLKGSRTHTIDWTQEQAVNIRSLPIFPYRYADKQTQEMIRNRGKMIWQCRFYKYVAYHGFDARGVEWLSNSRFMIDGKASRQAQLAIRTSNQSSGDEGRDDLGEEAMKPEDPPGGDFVLLLPAILAGFSMQDKHWKSLLMSRVRHVEWDLQAFQCLVLQQDTKDVIRALVAHRVSHSRSTDLIQSKGNGLILLFHGPPGTGKTLTTESVAEHAKKPLYRVTCGDIGTQPEAVEKYLRDVVNLAKSWGCVVLLDEAEVFLQERSLTDLKRNALVSVFLRVLEYYDGILILTSNRVGTIDEGFRSRIQLALEYPKLDRSSRQRIWENFIDLLNEDPTVSGEIDNQDLRKHLGELAKYELNGREIRNAINVARPLALADGEQVDFKCLKKVIGVQSRFDKYIRDMNEGLDDEKVAREEGKR